MSGTKKTTLNEFSGASWTTFTQKTKGTYSAKKTESGRSFWEILQTEDPRVEGRKTITTVVEAQIQRTLLINDARVPMVDQAGTPVMDAVENKIDTQEDLNVFQARCKEWDDVMSQVWCDLLQCCTGEPAVLLKSVADNDGKGAWQGFKKRWGVVSIATIMAGLEALLDYSPKGVNMAQHVTGWMDNIRKLKMWGIPLADLPALESMLFLRTLPNKYSAFVDNKKLQSEKLDDCAKLYEAAVAWSSTADKGDEADTTGKAMFGSGYDASSAEPGSKRTKTACYGCGETGHYKHECPALRGLACNRCSRKGHTAAECYSTTRADGSSFKSSTKGAGGRGRGRGARGKGRDRGGKGRDRGRGKAFAMQDTQQSSKRQLDEAYSAGKNAAVLEQANARIAQMEAKAKEIGMGDSFGCATPAVGALDDVEDDVGEALECLSLRDTVVLKADSGADDHYVNGDTPLHGATAFNRQVHTAGSDSTLSVTEEGMLAGTAQSTSGGVGIEIQAKKSEDFRYNLFSVRQAVRAGHAVVFAPGGSYIETTDGTRIPLRCTRSGWELHVTGCGGGGGEGYAFDAETGETFTQPERRSSL